MSTPTDPSAADRPLETAADRVAALTGLTGTLPSAADRPRPLMTVADRVATLVGISGTLVTAAVGFGVFSYATGNAVTGLLGLIPGVIAGIAAVYATYHTAAVGEPLVTPNSDPRTEHGLQLVPLISELAPDQTQGEAR